MVPGKRYAPEDYLQIAWRRKWLIIVPFLIGTVGAVVYSRSLPSVYTAETLILVVPQQVPRNYVASTVTAQIDQRLQAITQQVLSRTRLEQLIQEFDLYPEERRNGLMEDVVTRMRVSDIKIEIGRVARDSQSGTTIRVGYSYQNPLTATRVTERLSSLFIDANLRDRELLAEGTDQFIEAELINARNRLDAKEKAIAEYRQKYPWDQAEQVEHNRWTMVNTQQSLEKVGYELSQNRDRLLFLEKMLADLRAVEPPASTTPATTEAPQTAAAQLEAAKNALRVMEMRLKPEHPDVRSMKNTIAELTRKAEQEALAAPVSAEPGLASVSTQDRDRLMNISGEIMTLKGRIAEGEARERQFQALLAAQAQRVENYPIRAREMEALKRDYDVIKAHYHDLLRKKESAQIAANLEKQQIGEQMRIIDPARAPQRPTSPDRGRINLLGAAIGLCLGLALAGLIEYRDTSLRTDVDVVSALALPVLALVPVMKSTREVRRERRRKLLWSVAGVLTLVVSAAAAALWTLLS